jgi:hypothetical protein
VTAGDNKCDICDREPMVGVAAVPGFPVSLAWCRECLVNSVLPMFCVEATVCDGELTIKESFDKWDIKSVDQMGLAYWFLESSTWHDGKYVNIKEFLETQCQPSR